MLFIDTIKKIRDWYKNLQPVTKGALSIITVLAILYIAIPMPAFAALDFLAEWISTFLIFIAGLLAKLLTNIIIMVVSVAQYNDFVDSIAVTKAWIILRDLFNMILIILMLYTSVSSIIGFGGNFQWTSQVPKLILAAIAVNFSKTMAGAIIDAGQIFMLTFVNSFKDVAAGNLLNAIGLEKMVSLQPAQLEKLDFSYWSIASALLIADIALIIAVVVVAFLFIYFIQRIVWLLFLTAASPVAFLNVASLSFLSKISSQWWSKFMEQVFGGIAVAFTLWLAFAVMQTGPGESISLSNPNTSDSVNFETTNIPVAGEITSFATADTMLSFAFSLTLLWISLQLAKSTGGLAGSFAGSAATKLQKTGMAAVKGAGAGLVAATGYNVVKDSLKMRRDAIKADKEEKMQQRRQKFAKGIALAESNVKNATIGKAQSAITNAGGRLQELGNEYGEQGMGVSGALLKGVGKTVSGAGDVAGEALGVRNGDLLMKKVENVNKEITDKKIKSFDKMKDEDFEKEFNSKKFTGSKEEQIAYHAEAIKRRIVTDEKRKDSINFIADRADGKTKEFFQEYIKDVDPEAGYMALNRKERTKDEIYDQDEELKNQTILENDYIVKEDILNSAGATIHKKGKKIDAGTTLAKGTKIRKGNLKLNSIDQQYATEETIATPKELSADYKFNADTTVVYMAPGALTSETRHFRKGEILGSGNIIQAGTKMSAGNVMLQEDIDPATGMGTNKFKATKNKQAIVAEKGSVKRRSDGVILDRSATELRYDANVLTDSEKILGKETELQEDYVLNTELDPAEAIHWIDDAGVTNQSFSREDRIPKGAKIVKGTKLKKGMVDIDGNGHVKSAINIVYDDSGRARKADPVDLDSILKSIKDGKMDPQKFKQASMEILKAIAGEEDLNADQIANTCLTVLSDPGSTLNKDPERLKEIYDSIKDSKKKADFITYLSKKKEGRKAASNLTKNEAIDLRSKMDNTVAAGGLADDEDIQKLSSIIEDYCKTGGDITGDIIDLNDLNHIEWAVEPGYVDVNLFKSLGKQLNTTADANIVAFYNRLTAGTLPGSSKADKIKQRLNSLIKENNLDPEVRAGLKKVVNKFP